MHRNGVKVLGTFILEPGKAHAERMLDQVNDEFKVAKQLATLAEVFGFDGWLLNIELEFPKIIKDQTGKMCALIRSLKRLLGPGNVVWCNLLFSHGLNSSRLLSEGFAAGHMSRLFTIPARIESRILLQEVTLTF